MASNETSQGVRGGNCYLALQSWGSWPFFFPSKRESSSCKPKNNSHLQYVGPMIKGGQQLTAWMVAACYSSVKMRMQPSGDLLIASVPSYIPETSQRPFFFKKKVTNVHDARRSRMMALDVGSVLASSSSSARIQPDAAYLEWMREKTQLQGHWDSYLFLTGLVVLGNPHGTHIGS